MIITKLIGGLGNQLFQYAIGRCLVEKNNTVLKFDVSDFKEYKLRRYALDIFNIKASFIDIKLKRRFEHDYSNPIYRYVSKIIYNNYKFIKEDDLQFNKNILELNGNIYIDGYWQSEKYFEEIKNIIRKELTIKIPLAGLNNEISEQIKNKNSVSLHIRRGDYVTNKEVLTSIGVLDISYYYKAIDYISSKINNPHFFIFSDDKDWAINNFITRYPFTFVKQNDEQKNYEDLRLMSLCKHNIIANSSFSWWGAWLNNNPDKIIIAPKKWFAKESMNKNNIVPDDWIKI